ncbi:hypothetical protein [Streptomyces lavendulae]|nr:hypothetical protein [Streptomyces lavendulae]
MNAQQPKGGKAGGEPHTPGTAYPTEAEAPREWRSQDPRRS